MQGLRDHRVQLHKLAMKHQPVTVLDELSFVDDSDRVLDEKVHVFQSALESLGHRVPPSLNAFEARGPGFCCQCMTSVAADLFYEAGFLDIEGRDHLSKTPLMCSGRLQYIQWLLSKGADIHATRNEVDSETSELRSKDAAIHLVVSNTVYLISQSDPLPEMIYLFADETLDSCSCHCSPYGCSSLKIILGYSWHWTKLPGLQMMSSIVQFIEKLESTGPLNQQISRAFWTDIIRLQTSETLGIKHTCCQAPCNYYDAGALYNTEMDVEETQEINDEQEYMINTLNALVIEFEKEFRKAFNRSKQTCSSFLKGYWRTRMSEFLEDGILERSNEIAKLAEGGIWVQNTAAEDFGRAWIDTLFEQGKSWESLESENFREPLEIEHQR